MEATLPTPSECSMAGRAQQIWFISEAGEGHSSYYEGDFCHSCCSPREDRWQLLLVLGGAEPQLLLFMNDPLEFWVSSRNL